MYWFSENQSSPYVPQFAEDLAEWNKKVDALTGHAKKVGYTLSGSRALGPKIKNPYGLTEPAHLVEVEVNGGRGRVPRNDVHFVITDLRILEGTEVFPYKLADVLSALREQYDMCITHPEHSLKGAMRRADDRIEEGRDEPLPGAGHPLRIDAIYATWDDQRGTLIVYFETRVKRRNRFTVRAAGEFEVDAKQGARCVGFLPPM